MSELIEEDTTALEEFEALLWMDEHSKDVPWDKGTPKYELDMFGRTFFVRSLKVWCTYYKVNYQLCLRAMRENNGGVTFYKNLMVRTL